MTGELSKEEIIELATQEFNKYLQAIEKKDIASGIDACTNLRTLLDAAINEISFEDIFYRGEIEYENNSFCFTGKFTYGERNICEAAVIAKGGAIEKSVTKKLNYLIVGSNFSPDWKHQNYGRKIQKAL